MPKEKANNKFKKFNTVNSGVNLNSTLQTPPSLPFGQRGGARASIIKLLVLAMPVYDL
ncbi:MAG: hypothetical protein WAT71_08895 [Ignavibacteria bacterium]